MSSAGQNTSATANATATAETAATRGGRRTRDSLPPSKASLQLQPKCAHCLDATCTAGTGATAPTSVRSAQATCSSQSLPKAGFEKLLLRRTRTPVERRQWTAPRNQRRP